MLTSQFIPPIRKTKHEYLIVKKLHGGKKLTAGGGGEREREREKLTTQFHPRGKNGPARFYPGEETDWGKFRPVTPGPNLGPIFVSIKIVLNMRIKS